MPETKEKNKQDSILWIDPVIAGTVTGKHGKSEILFAYMTRVIDGMKYKVAPDGHTYCAGPYKNNGEVEKQVATPAANSGDSDSLRCPKTRKSINVGKTTTPLKIKRETAILVAKKKKSTHKGRTTIENKPINSFGTRPGRQKKSVDEEKIIDLAKTMTVRKISEETGVPRSTVGRIIAGQKVLV